MTTTLQQPPAVAPSELADRQVAMSILDRLRTRYRKTITWHIAVFDYQAALSAGLEAVPPNLRKMPDPEKRGWMYDDAGQLNRLLELGLERASNMADLAATITAAELHLAKLPRNGTGHHREAPRRNAGGLAL